MEAIREVTEIKNHRISLRLPPGFNHKKVEVLVFPLDAQATTGRKRGDAKLMARIFKEAKTLQIPPELDIDGLMQEMGDGLP